MSKKSKNKEVTAGEELDQMLENQQVEVAPELSELEQVQASLQEEKDKFLRLFAEFENYKKRTGRERLELFKTANEETMVAMLTILDDFDRALKEIYNSNDNSNFEGIVLIHNKLKETLRSKGLQVIETEKGAIFDAEQHEAITQIPAPSEDLKGKIIDVIERGYSLGEKIIRYPKVVIGQ